MATFLGRLRVIWRVSLVFDQVLVFVGGFSFRAFFSCSVIFTVNFYVLWRDIIRVPTQELKILKTATSLRLFVNIYRGAEVAGDL